MNKNSRKSPGSTWQARKSASTRTLILEAAIACFYSTGYARTTTTLIADRAGLSRGAMLHHFPSKASLIVEAIEHLNERRLTLYRDKIAAIPNSVDKIDSGIEACWDVLTDPTYAAFHELTVAARTDAQLAQILRPAMEKFEKQSTELTRELFPEWQRDPEIFFLANELTQTLMDGLAVSYMSSQSADKSRRMLSYLKDQLRHLLGSAEAKSAAE